MLCVHSGGGSRGGGRLCNASALVPFRPSRTPIAAHPRSASGQWRPDPILPSSDPFAAFCHAPSSQAWAIVVPVSFITCVAAGMLTRFTTTDPDSRRNNNYHLNDAQTSTQNGAAFKEQVRGVRCNAQLTATRTCC